MKRLRFTKAAIVWFSTTALTGVFAVAASPILAAGGAGGANPGSGGADALSGAGASGTPGAAVGQGGGGGGAGLSSGGDGGAGGAGAAGGAGGSRGMNGGTGADGLDGGGGGGGGSASSAFGSLAFTAVGSNTAAAGGAGGNSNGSGGGGGGGGIEVIGSGNLRGSINSGITRTGGAGGAGGISTGGTGGSGGSGGTAWFFTGANNIIKNNGTLQGGAGGNGGFGGLAGGNGGTGGDGVFATNATITNNGTINGGAGGTGGTGFTDGAAGAGGSGISGVNLTIIQNGTIAGGVSGDGAQQLGLNLIGGTNSISFAGATSGITGGIGVIGSLDFNQASGSTTVSNVISGTGSIIRSGGGIITLSGINTYAGGTTITGGTLGVSGTGTLGATTNATTVNGATAILDLGSTTQTQDGGVTVRNGGTIRNGTLSSSGTFVFETGTISAILAGAGGVNKTTAGIFTLSGINTYTGGTSIDAGTLQVSGSIAASGFLFVNPGATLAGTGVVPFTFVDNGATLAPGPLGNGTGTLTINDRLVLCNCSNYAVKVTANGNDLAHVVPNFAPGDAFLDGTVRVSSPTLSYRFKSPYTILTADGGLNDTRFASLTTPTGIAGTLGYDPNNVFLTLTSALGSIGGLDPNQRAIANTLDRAFNASGTSGPLGGIFTGNIAQNLTQASGQGATGTQTTTFDAMGQFVSTMTDPFSGGRNDGPSQGGVSQYADDAMAYAGRRKTDAFAAFTKAPPRVADPFAQRWSIWATGYGGSQTTDGNAALGSNTTTSRIAAGAVGLDYRISPATVAGFAMAGGGTNFSVAGAGTGRSDLFQAGAFVRHTVGPAYLTAALAYGWQDVTTDRTVTIAGVDRLRATFNANALSGRVEGGYRFNAPMSGVGLTPYAAAQATTLYLPAYGEQAIAGANTFALNFASRDVTASRSELGLRTDKTYLLNDSILTLRGRAAWAHDYNIDRSIGATFQTLPGASFVVNGARQARDAALTTASAELRWRNNWSVATTFEGEFSNVTRAYTGKGAVRYVW